MADNTGTPYTYKGVQIVFHAMDAQFVATVNGNTKKTTSLKSMYKHIDAVAEVKPFVPFDVLVMGHAYSHPRVSAERVVSIIWRKGARRPEYRTMDESSYPDAYADTPANQALADKINALARQMKRDEEKMEKMQGKLKEREMTEEEQANAVKMNRYGRPL